MNNLRILRVQVVERVAKLIGPRQNLLAGNGPAPRHHLEQIFARDVLHHQKLAFAFSEMIANARQRRMMKSRQQSRLSLELFPQTFVGKQRLF